MPAPTLPSDCRVLRPGDRGYPTALRRIVDPPATLWVRGALPDPARSVAVVGTRTPTEWGLEAARDIATAAVARGLTVVSGLSAGIDIAAHRAALAADGRTVAVLGSGIEPPTPREHRRAAEAILAAGGCLLTEQPPGTRRSPRRLAARNRIQVALSAATIVVQTGTSSGTMTTAAHAHAQGRPVAVVEPPASERDHPDNAGNVELLQQPGVQPLEDLHAVGTLLASLGPVAAEPAPTWARW